MADDKPPEASKVISIVRDLKTEQLEREAIQAEGNDTTPPRATNGATKSAPARRPRAPLTPADEVARWRLEGPLVHEPTGFASIDAAFGGGPTYGSRGYINGAPDAAKTVVLVQVLDTYSRRGIVCGLLAADEETSDLVTRLAQRRGIDRYQCERRNADDLAAISDELGELGNLFVYDGADWTIDDAADDLAERAKKANARAAFGIDSIQTAECDAERRAERELSMPAALKRRTKAIRYAAVTHRMIVLSTSEVGRENYKGPKDDRPDAMASAKWSGDVDYAARFIISLSAVDSENLIEVEIPKNKLGPKRKRAAGNAIYLRIDLARQTLEEVDHKAPSKEEKRQAAEDERGKQITEDAAKLAVLTVESPGLGRREWEERVQGLLKMGKTRMGAGRGRLGAALVAKRLGVKATDPAPHYIDGSLLDKEILAAVPLHLRAAVMGSRPPEAPVSPGEGVPS